MRTSDRDAFLRSVVAPRVMRVNIHLLSEFGLKAQELV